MTDLKFSVVIPYKQRLDNIRLVLSALAEQSMDRSDFEVLIGAMEYAPEFVSVAGEFTDRIDVVSILSADEWNLCQARNLALRQARGQVTLILDADMVLPPHFLDNLYDRHYAHGQNVCVLGQMIGYDDVVETDVEHVEAAPFSHYREVLAGLEERDEVVMDDRWNADQRQAFAAFPWVFARGGLVAVPTATVQEHGITYDVGFRGWGPEDQEWALRVALTGTPIVLGQEVYGLHLPHLRSVADNGRTAWLNNRYYLAKWPRLELELALAFGWSETARILPGVRAELAAAGERLGLGPRYGLGAVRGTVDGRAVVVVGAAVDRAAGTPGPETAALFDTRSPLTVLPLAGFALPYADGEIEECHVLPPVAGLDARYRDAVLREAERVALKVSTSAGTEPR
ncbi:glycosyltransferase [Streptomyces sp. MBT65]|uniref:glycosyltransferase family A protein n=1 Tax=Streptomyces sp. MBT65 TaxID=1488395 RepID=UPI00190E00BD|nr:glycosyltransferase family 2 protein [Streptomyces sp. MBT65]MBK3580919.1 glycosyltransferase [Streptomyces sp. MBT65]